MGIQPTSRAAFGPGGELVDMQQRFEAFERELDLPGQPVDREHLEVAPGTRTGIEAT